MTAALVPLVVLLPLLGAAIALIPGRHRRAQIAVSTAVLAAVAVIAAVLLVVVDAGEPIAVVGRRLARRRSASCSYVDRLVGDHAASISSDRAARRAALLRRPGRRRRHRRDAGLDLPPVLPDPVGRASSTRSSRATSSTSTSASRSCSSASYVLITLGGTGERIRAGVTYIVVSLVSSILFLARSR